MFHAVINCKKKTKKNLKKSFIAVFKLLIVGQQFSQNSSIKPFCNNGVHVFIIDTVRGTLEKRITKIFQYVAKDTLTLLVSVKRVLGFNLQY